VHTLTSVCCKDIFKILQSGTEPALLHAIKGSIGRLLIDVSFFAHVQGIIQHATINNLAFGRNVEETLRILQAIQYVQENPDEVLHYTLAYVVASHIRDSPQGTCRTPRSVTAIATPALCGSCMLY